MIEKEKLLTVEVSELSADAIEAVAEKKNLALRIRGYCEPDICSFAIRNLVGMAGEGYRIEPKFRKLVGGALFDTAGCDPEVLEYYLGNAARWYAACRELFNPHLSPADKISQDLKQAWRSGSHIQRIGGRPAFAGIIREFREDCEARPHQDMTNWDLPFVPEAQTLKTQLSCVVHLSCAGSGGELELWENEIETSLEYENLKVQGDYGLDRNRIGPPSAVISPLVGDLIVFNARCIHAVRRITRGLRCSQSLFIGYRGSDQPLSVFS